MSSFLVNLMQTLIPWQSWEAELIVNVSGINTCTMSGINKIAKPPAIVLPLLQKVCQLWRNLWHCTHDSWGSHAPVKSIAEIVQPFTFHYQQLYQHLKSLDYMNLSMKV